MPYPAVYILDKKIKKDTFRRTRCLSHAGHVFGSPLVIAIAKLLHGYYLVVESILCQLEPANESCVSPCSYTFFMGGRDSYHEHREQHLAIPSTPQPASMVQVYFSFPTKCLNGWISSVGGYCGRRTQKTIQMHTNLSQSILEQCGISGHSTVLWWQCRG